VFLVKYGLYLCSIWFSQQTATVFPNSINRLGSVAETSSVSCEVRTLSECSVWFSQQTASVSTNRINRWGSVTET
jgi:hypothetical protein